MRDDIPTALKRTVAEKPELNNMQRTQKRKKGRVKNEDRSSHFTIGI
jgi:hypothetical protein